MRRGSTHAPSSEGPKGYHSLIVGLDREPDRCCTSRAVKRPPGRRSAISGVRASTAATSPRQRTASVGLDHWHCGTGIWRSSKNVNNLIEQDTRGVKQRIAAMLGFKGLSNAAITIGLSAPAALLLEPSKKLACKLRHSFENTSSHMTPALEKAVRSEPVNVTRIARRSLDTGSKTKELLDKFPSAETENSSTAQQPIDIPHHGVFYSHQGKLLAERQTQPGSTMKR